MTEQTDPEVKAILRRLDDYIAALDRDRLVEVASRQGSMPLDRAAVLVRTYLGEMPVGLRIIAPHLKPGQRLLEIGSGIGVLSAFLRQEGFEILGIEPGQDGGFGFMDALHAAVVEQLPEAHHPEILRIGAEALKPDVHGRFDVIFSANVLEHIMALDTAVPAMRDVLTPGGVMRHLCPNYHFPYEPHLGIPLIPVMPQTTRHLVPGVIARNRGIWDGVNFITARRIARLASRNGLMIAFDRGIMAGYMRRLTDDPTFAERHAGVVGALARRPRLVRVLAGMLEYLPPQLASPMTLTLRHA